MFLWSPPKFKPACADAGDDTSVDEQVGSRDEPGMLAQQESSCLGYLVAGARTSCGRGIDHVRLILSPILALRGR